MGNHRVPDAASLAIRPELRDSDWQVTSAGAEQRHGGSLAFEEGLSEPVGQFTHGLDRTDEVAEPAFVGSADEADVVRRIDVQPAEDRRQVFGDVSAPGRTGSAAAPESDPVSWGIRVQQPLPGPDHAGPPGPGRQARQAGAGKGPHAGRATGGDALAQRLKRVFQIDVETCPSCGGTVKIIACIEDPPVMERILRHLDGKNLPGLWLESRAPPAERGRLLH